MPRTYPELGASPEAKAALARRNFMFMVAEGAVFNVGMAFVDPNNVVSVFINAYTGSLELAGLANALRLSVFYVAQFVLGLFFARIKHPSRFMHIQAFILRPVLLLTVPFLLSGLDGVPMVAVFLICYTAFFISDGLTNLPWMEIAATTLPQERRGLMQGYQQFFAAIFGFATGFFIKMILDSALPQHIKYVILFGACGAFLGLNAVLLYFVRGYPHVVPERRSDPLGYIKSLPALLIGHKAFQRVLVCRCLMFTGSMAAPLLVLFGRRALALPAESLTLMIYVQVAGQLLGGLLWGNLGRRAGYVACIILSQVFLLITGAAGAALCLFSGAVGAGAFVVLGVMVLLSGVNGVSYIGFMNHIVNIAPEEHRSTYLVIQGLALLPFTFSSYLAGVLADSAGFTPVFIIVLAAGVLGVWTSTRLKRDEVAAAE